jgi:hypothetical protein
MKAPSLLLLVPFFALFSDPATAQAPRWLEGTSWVVKTVYRQMPEHKEDIEEKDDKENPEHAATPWTPPVYWTFRVKRIKEIPGGYTYLIQVQDKDGSRASMASLIVNSSFSGEKVDGKTPNLDSLNITGGKFYSVVAGELRPEQKIFTNPGDEPVPVIGDHTIIPCCFPVLPLLSGGPGSPETKKVKLFTISEELDGLTFARDIEQTEYLNKPLETFIDKDLVAHLESKKFPTTGLKMVELTRKFDGMVVRQVWADDLPWFLYSESPTRKSWLWEVSGESTKDLDVPDDEDGSDEPVTPSIAPGSGAPLPPEPGVRISPEAPPSPSPEAR